MEDTINIQQPEVQTGDPVPQQQDPPSKRLWNAIVKEKLYTKSFDEFSKQFSTPDAVKKLHDGLKEENLYSKGSDEFSKQFFPDIVKKKDNIQLPSKSSDTSSPLPVQKDRSSFSDLIKPQEFPKQTSESVSSGLGMPKQDQLIREQQVKEAPQRAALKKERTDTAIDETAQRVLISKGITSGKGSAQYNKEKKKIQEAIDNGNVALVYDKKQDKHVLKRTTGFWETAVDSWNKVMKSNDDAMDFVNNMTEEQQVEQYKKEKEEAKNEFPYQGSVPSKYAGSLGQFAGENTPAVGKTILGYGLGAAAAAAAPESFGTSLAGLPLAASFLATAPDMVYHGAKKEIIDGFEQLKKQHPEWSDVQAMHEAGKRKWAGGAGGLLNAAVLMTSGGNLLKTPIGEASKKVFSNALRGTINSAVKVGLSTGLVEAAVKTEGLAEGIKMSPQQIYEKSIETAKDNATLASMLHLSMLTVHKLAATPPLVYNAVKRAIIETAPIPEVKNELQRNENQGNIPPGTTEKITTDLEAYKNALDKTQDGLSEKSKTAVAGLIQKKQNLVDELAGKDSSAKEIYKEQIDAIDAQIAQINKTGKVSAVEYDNLTGEKYTPNKEPVVAEPSTVKSEGVQKNTEEEYFHNELMRQATTGKEQDGYAQKAFEIYPKIQDNEGLQDRHEAYLKTHVFNDASKTLDENLQKYAEKYKEGRPNEGATGETDNTIENGNSTPEPVAEKVSQPAFTEPSIRRVSDGVAENLFNETTKTISDKRELLKSKISDAIKRGIEKWGSKKEEQAYYDGSQSEKMIEVPNFRFSDPRYESDANYRKDVQELDGLKSDVQNLHDLNELHSKSFEYDDSNKLIKRLGSIVFGFGKGSDATRVRDAFEANKIMEHLKEEGVIVDVDKIIDTYRDADASKSQIQKFKNNAAEITDIIDKKGISTPKSESDLQKQLPNQKQLANPKPNEGTTGKVTEPIPANDGQPKEQGVKEVVQPDANKVEPLATEGTSTVLNEPNEKAAEIPVTETKAGATDQSVNQVVEGAGEGGGKEPPKVTPIEGESSGGDWTAIRKEKQREISAVKEAYERQGVKAWSETLKNGLEKTQKLHPEKNLFDAATTVMHSIKAGLGHGDLTTDEALATMQYLKRELGQKRSQLADAVTSDNPLERNAALMQDEALGKDYENTALAIKDITTTAGRTLNYAQSELRFDPEHGLQIRRMELMKAKGGEKLTPEEMKWSEEKWNQEMEIAKKEAEVREQAMKEAFDNKIADLRKEFEEKQSGKSTPSKTAKEKSLSQKGKTIADKIRKLKKPKGSTNIDFTLGTWDLAVEGIAKLVEAGSTIAEAIEKLVKDGAIGFKEQKDRDAFENHIVESVPEQKGKSEFLNDIKEFATEHGVTDVTNEMVGGNLIRDYINSHIGEVEQRDILDVAVKDLKEILPDVTKEKLIEAYLKENEFKQPTKKDIEGGLAEAKKQLNNIAKLTEDIDDLNGLKEIRQRSFPTERAKSEAEQELISKKAEKLKEIKERRKQILEDNKRVSDETQRQLAKVKALQEKKARLENGIVEKSSKRSPTPDTPEIEGLKREVKEIEKSIREAESARKEAEAKVKRERDAQIKADNKRVESETIRQLTRVNDLKERLKELEAGVKPKTTPQEKSVDTPEIEALKGKIKDAEKAISDRDKSIREENKKLESEVIRQVTKVNELQDKKAKLEKGIREKRSAHAAKIDTPEIENLKQAVKEVDKSLREAESLAKKMTTDLQNKKDKLDEMDAGIKRAENGLNQIKTHRNKTAPEIDAEIEAKKKELKTAIRDNATDEQQQAKKLAAEKENTRNKIKEFQRKLADGEFEEPEPIKLRKQDAELIRLKKQQSVIEEAYRKKQKELQEKNKTTGGRLISLARAAYVATLIGKMSTLGKVAGMTVMRPTSEVLRKTVLGPVFDTFFPGISKVAERGGEGHSYKQLKAAFGAFFRTRGAEALERLYDTANARYENAQKELADYKKTSNPSDEKITALQRKVTDKLVDVQGTIIYKFIGGSSIKDALQAFVNRANEIEKQFGHVEGESIKDGDAINKTDYVLGFIGRSHSALKTFSGRFSFAAGFMARLEGAVKNGEDITSGDRLLEIAHESYLDWERGKYQQSNAISDLWNKAINSFEEGESGERLAVAKAAKFIAQADVAITRVPVNILHEAVMEFTLGAFRVAGLLGDEASIPKLMKNIHGQLKNDGFTKGEKIIDGVTYGTTKEAYRAALKDAINQMDSKQAATIVRAFTKGGMGVGLYALALISGAIHFGIFPHLGQKKKKDEADLKPDELNPGQVMIGENKLGENVSAVIEHAPILWTTFMGLGMAQQYNDEIKKGKSTPKAIEKAIYTHLKVIESSIPQTNLLSPTKVGEKINQMAQKRLQDMGWLTKDEYKGFSDEQLKSPTFEFIKNKKIKLTAPTKKYTENGEEKLMTDAEFEQYTTNRANRIEHDLEQLRKNGLRSGKTDNESVQKEVSDIVEKSGKDARAEVIKKEHRPIERNGINRYRPLPVHPIR